jgi:hypothetical protein
MVLWRDGKDAVLSIKVNGGWHRVVAVECKGVFHIEVTAAELRAVPPFRHWDARSGGQKKRREKERQAAS